MIFGGIIPGVIYLIILAFNLIPDLGIELYSMIISDNLKTLLKINNFDICLLPLLIGLTFTNSTPWIINATFERH